MGNGASLHEQPGPNTWWIRYCRQKWRSLRTRQLDEFLGLQRPPLRRGQSFSNLDELVKKITQEPVPFIGEADDTDDLKSAIAKLNNGSILHTEKRAIERLLAQRYEEALAAAANQEEAETLGGASEVLRQVLVVFHQNNLPTELDRIAADEQPAEWRKRCHVARRRAFLVVRSLVRLKREVKRLAAPIGDLGWLLPVAAKDRWGELKALAARYRQLETELQDAEVAVAQLTQLKEMQAKVLPSPRSPAGGRISPQRTLRSAAGRMNGMGTSGRAVSESGALNSRARPRAALTADPPPPPVPGGRVVRREGPSATSSGMVPSSPPILAGCAAGVSPLRTPMQGRKGGAGGSDAVVGAGGIPSPAALVPTLSMLRAPAATPSPLNGRRLSATGGSSFIGGPGSSMTPRSGAASATAPSTPLVGGSLVAQTHVGVGILTGISSPPLCTPSVGTPRGGHREPVMMRSPVQSSTQIVRQTFITGDGSGAATSLPTVPPALGRGPQVLDLTAAPNPSAHRHTCPGEPTDFSINPHGTAVELSTSPAVPGPLQRRVAADATSTGSGQRGAGTRNWGVDPAPPMAPPPTAGTRRPLGALGHTSASPPLGVLGSPRMPAGGPPARHTSDGASSRPAAAPPELPVLIQEGETLEQALARFRLLADDTRCALVDTARQFRCALDLCNSAWPDQRWWLAAHTQDDAALDTWPGSGEYIVNRADMVRCLKAGTVAFQFMCASDEALVGPSGNRFDWWTSDPWEVAADLAPDLVAEAQAAQRQQRPGPGEAPRERLVGVPLGVRVLEQLANSVVETAGPLALEALPVILHISERQREAMAADLLQYPIYKRLRRNLYVVVQRSQPVMRYNAADDNFLPDLNQPKYMPGSGYSMLQLLWPGHAMFLNDAGQLERLPHSLMDELRERNTEWFVSRNGQDLSLLMDDGALDMRSLANVCWMWNTPHLRYSLAVEATSTYVKHRDLIAQYGSVLLCRKPKVVGMVMGRLDGAVRLDRYTAGTKPQLPVVELMTCELNSAHMQEELSQIAASRATTTSVGLGRYIFRFEILASLLTGPTVLRPKLLPAVDVKALEAWDAAGLNRPLGIMEDVGPPAAAPITSLAAAATAAQAAPGGAMQPFPIAGAVSEQQLAYAASHGMDTMFMRLHLSMSDLTMHHASKVVALKAHRLPVFVRGPQDAPALLEVLSRSDQDLLSAKQRLAAKLPSFTRQQKPGQSFLVFVQDNSVSLTATNVAAGLARRERGDRIHLVTVVPTEAQRGEGAALLERLMKAFRTHADVLTHVLSQEGRGLLECVADVVSQHSCNILVVGSTSITAVANAVGRNAPLVLPATAAKTPGTAGPGAGAAGRAPAAGNGGGQGTISGGLDDVASSELLVSSVALSILRTFALPVILVTANVKNYLKRVAVDGAPGGPRQPPRPAVGGVGGATSGRLLAMAVVERHSRPMMHHLARCLLEPMLRQDAVTLAQVLPQGMAQGNAGYDSTCIQAVALKTLMSNFESIAAANDFHTPNKVHVQGDWHSALCGAARDLGTQLLSVQLPPNSTKSLPTALLQLVRSAPCPVLVYPERVTIPGSNVEDEEGEED
ncbi:hypothetical protein Agub_g4898 [Astrephomene gubernaculifera]|uniref:Uncharacterized protein n=1 Tax=Astrephomene gubernaculifera TaxID=47775 RepID=A0AAD3DNM4_9CHLO|nr:hypothetical protein Agub_g4898 [Astrephomene gubernaculifera]